MAIDLVERRRKELDRLGDAGDGARPDLETRQTLKALRKSSSEPCIIFIRSEFARRKPALDPSEINNQRIVDRPRPDLPRRPPLSLLTSMTKGIALRTALTLPYVVQSDPTTLDSKNGRLRLPILNRSESHPALTDLVAIDARFTEQSDSDYLADRISNRDRQMKSALVSLSTTGIGMTKLPNRGRGRDGFADVRLYIEDGQPRQVIYKPPNATADTIDVPATFYLNGWIHVLTSSEIAMWLMLRDLTAQERRKDPAHNGWVRINATDRLLQYDLTRSTWDTHHRLTDFGLLEVTKDTRRRANGTMIGGKPQASMPNYFRLIDKGLAATGITVVARALDPSPPGAGT